jgi:AcrR family transcriptional regulator
MAPADRREQLLDVTESILRRDGPVSFTMDALAAEAGVTKALLYHYFVGRDALLAAVLDRAFEPFSAAVAAEVGVCSDLPSRARVLVRRILDAGPGGEIVTILRNMGAEPGSELEAAQARNVLETAGFVTQILADEYALDPRQAGTLAAGAMGAAWGVAAIWRASGWSLDEATDLLTTMCLGLLDAGARSLLDGG